MQHGIREGCPDCSDVNRAGFDCLKKCVGYCRFGGSSEGLEYLIPGLAEGHGVPLHFFISGIHSGEEVIAGFAFCDVIL